MKSFVCEMCGGNDLEKTDGMYVCKSCGTKFTPEEAKKLLVEVTVKQDNSQKSENLLSAARKAREAHNWKSAEVYYQDLFAEDPDNWEAAYFSVYAVSMQCKIANIASACNDVYNMLSVALPLVKKAPDDEWDLAVRTISEYTIDIANTMYMSASNHYLEIDSSIAYKYKGELQTRQYSAMKLVLFCGELIDSLFGDTDAGKYSVNPIIEGLHFKMHNITVTLTLPESYEEKCLNIIGKYEPEKATELRETIKFEKEKKVKSNLTGGLIFAILGAVCIFCGFNVAEDDFWQLFLQFFGYFLVGMGAIRLIIYALTKLTD